MSQRKSEQNLYNEAVFRLLTCNFNKSMNRLIIHNNLTGKKEIFVPIQENRIHVYVCGMTVYDYCHLGHARVMVGFDAIIRYLRYRGYEVKYVRNITDIDDKIIQRANELGESIETLTNRFIGFMNEDLEALSIQKPDHEPRATDYVTEIINLISILMHRGFAYLAENGDVYYRTRKFEEYGKLSCSNLDDLIAGARVDVGEQKEDPIDFVLWKHSKANEPKWDSPWGEGRPGWHIECSAMSMDLLGNHFDIHGGGMDLLFPHHENEIAQSEAATGEKFVNYWMHNGYLQINAEKMSKSLKNFFTIREILDTDSDRERMGEVLRFFFLCSHYRSPLNYSEKNLENSKLGLRRIYVALQKAGQRGILAGSKFEDDIVIKFHSAMDDDFNTPEAIAVIFDCVRRLNRALEKNDRTRAERLCSTLYRITNALGLIALTPERFLGLEDKGEEIDRIQDLVKARAAARRERNWSKADQIRTELTELGVEIEDLADGTTNWRRIVV